MILLAYLVWRRSDTFPKYHLSQVFHWRPTLVILSLTKVEPTVLKWYDRFYGVKPVDKQLDLSLKYKYT